MTKQEGAFSPETVTIPCADGVTLGGHYWRGQNPPRHGVVVINCATGVLSRYYHYYAQFLVSEGFEALTYDYRGVGLSRPARLRGCGYRWRDWGELDFDAALGVAQIRAAGAPIRVVGHSIGGFLPGFAPQASMIDRLLTVGAQYAYWPDYHRRRRLALVLKWHVAMPLLTSLCGYFPGRRLGWLEDLPAGVAHEWSFRGRRMERSHPRALRADVLRRFAAVQAPILAVAATDDEFATTPAVERALAYYSGAERAVALIAPADYGLAQIGHFSLFHARHRNGFWRETLLWLRDGVNPWAFADAGRRPG